MPTFRRALSVSMLSLFFAAPLSAQDVAVREFDGPRAEATRAAVIEVAREEGLRVIRDADDADLVVSAELRGSRRRARIRLDVEGGEGQRLARRTFLVGSRDAFEERVGEVLRQAVARHRSEARERAQRRRSRASRDEDREEDREEEEELEEDEDEDALEGEGGPVRPLVEVLAGARLAGRLASIEMIDGNLHKNHVAYPELNLDAIVRPWRDASGIERGLVFRGAFGHAVGLRSRNTLTDEPVSTTFFRAYGEIGLLFEPDPNVELGLGVGFGWDAFAFEPQALTVLPSAEYAYLRPNLRGRFRIEQELAVLDLVAGYRGVLARGALSEHFGEEGQTQGFDIVARLGGSLDLGFAYGVEAGVTSYFHFFSGDATTTPGREGTDVALWLGAHVGFAIR